MTVDLAAIQYLEALEQKLTRLLPLTNCTPGGVALRQILMHDLRPTIATCYAELDRMGQDFEAAHIDHMSEAVGCSECRKPFARGEMEIGSYGSLYCPNCWKRVTWKGSQ